MSDFDPLERAPLPRRASEAVKSHRGLAEDRFLRTTPDDGGLLHLWDNFEAQGIQDHQLDPYQYEGGQDALRGDTSGGATMRDFASGERNFGFQYPLMPEGLKARRATTAEPEDQATARTRGGSFTEGLRDHWKGNFQGASAVPERGNRLQALANDRTFSDVQSYQGQSAEATPNATSDAAQRAAQRRSKSKWLPWNWNWSKLLPWNWGKRSGGGGEAQPERPRQPQRNARAAARRGQVLSQEEHEAHQESLLNLLF